MHEGCYSDRFASPPDSVRLALTTRNALFCKTAPKAELNTKQPSWRPSRAGPASYPPRTPILPKLTHQQHSRETKNCLDRRASVTSRARPQLGPRMRAPLGWPRLLPRSPGVNAERRRSEAPSITATQASRHAPFHASCRFPGPSKETTPASRGSGDGSTSKGFQSQIRFLKSLI